MQDQIPELILTDHRDFVIIIPLGHCFHAFCQFGNGAVDQSADPFCEKTDNYYLDNDNANDGHNDLPHQFFDTARIKINAELIVILPCLFGQPDSKPRSPRVFDKTGQVIVFRVGYRIMPIIAAPAG